jgi:hypothetical protein
MIDISGRRFGRLVALETAGKRWGRFLWLCRCDCGVESVFDGNHLRRGMSKSCGCLMRETSRALKFVHGGTGSQEHAIWRGMINRCENPNVRGYPGYGGRGIRVCARWRADFTAFLSDLGPRPSRQHSLERLNPDGNYEPGNVVWSTALAQANNKRNTRFVEYNGERMSLCDAVRLAGSVVHYEAAWVRIRSGWSVERAVETPRLHVSPNARRAA